MFSKIQNRLIAEEKYSVMDSALKTADIMNYYCDEVKAAMLDWSEGKSVKDFSLGDASVVEVMEEVNCSEFQALCILNATHRNENIFEDAVLVLWEDEVRL